MKLWSGLGRVLAMASLVVLTTGCDPASGSSVSHEDDPDFARGKNRLARNMPAHDTSTCIRKKILGE